MIAILCLSIVLLGSLAEGQRGCGPARSYWPYSNNGCNMFKPCCFPTFIGVNRCTTLSRRECQRRPYVANAEVAAESAAAEK